MDAEFIKWLVSLGVGGVLAAFIFSFYRKDVKQFTDLWKHQTEQLNIVIKENTQSNTKLIGLLENLERNAVRKEDIINLVERRMQERGGYNKG